MNRIYYFSGTGNSLFAAKVLAEEIGETELIPIASVMNQEKIAVSGERVGISFPVYMFGLPLIIQRFAKKLEFEGNPYLFGIATNGGLAGSTLLQLNDLLEEKGQSLSCGITPAMPGNYTPLYEGDPKDKAQKKVDSAKKEVKEFAEIVKNKEKGEVEANNFFINFIFSKLIRWGGIRKVPNGDKDFWVQESCTSCGTCEEVCPVKNITMENGQPVWHHHCEQCMACMQYCPVEAIQLGKKTVDRRRYRNPEIEVSEIIAQNE